MRRTFRRICFPVPSWSLAAQPAPLASAASIQQVDTPVADSLRILLVDDYEPIRSLFSRLLSRQDGIQVVGVAGPGEEAIGLAQACEPDVVVMDVVMPGFGGVEATRRLRQALPRVRVVGHSANDAEAVMRAAGADAFVRKGEPTHVLVDAIRAAAV